MTIDKITSSIGSSLLFQSLRQNVEEYHQGANKVGRIIYQCALAKITSSSLSMAIEGASWLSSSSKNFVRESLIGTLAIPVILNLGDIFSIPAISSYRRELFVINSNFSTICYAIMNIAIATLFCGTGSTLGVVALGALHAEPIIERLGLPHTMSSILSISNKLIGSLYGMCIGNCIVQSIGFFQTIRTIEKLFLLHIQNKEAQLDALTNLKSLPRCAATNISSDKVIPARYHLVREDIINVPPLPSEELPDFSEMLSQIDWENNSRAKDELMNRLKNDSAWCDQWGNLVSIEEAIQHVQQGAKNFSDYMATCPSSVHDRAMWILINLNKKTLSERIPYLIEMALHMHYCIAGKIAEIETTYGILFNEIDNTLLESKIHQIMQYKREDLFKNICQEEVEKIYGTLTEKIHSSEEEMKRYQPKLSDTLAERVEKCLYYIDSFVSHKIWKFRWIIVEKFKERYMNDVHVYNELKKELTEAMKQQKTPSGFILTRLVHWIVIKIHELILSPEVMNIRVESLKRMRDEYSTDFILSQLQESLQNKDVLHPINHQNIIEWLQLELRADDIKSIYHEDTSVIISDKIKDSYLLYLLVRIGLLEVSNEFAADYGMV